MSISNMVQQVIFNAFGIVWLGGGAIIFMRCGLLQNASIWWFKQETGWAMGNPFFVVGSLHSACQARWLLHDPRHNAESELSRSPAARAGHGTS